MREENECSVTQDPNRQHLHAKHRSQNLNALALESGRATRCSLAKRRMTKDDAACLAQMSEGEDEAMQAYEEEELEEGPRGKGKKKPSIERLAREAQVNRSVKAWVSSPGSSPAWAGLGSSRRAGLRSSRRAGLGLGLLSRGHIREFRGGAWGA